MLFRLLLVALFPPILTCGQVGQASAIQETSDQLEHFEKRVRPALIEHCYKCHSADGNEIEGGLRLDIKAGWQQGGDSGNPAIIPGDPEQSPLIQSVRHDGGYSAMPPKHSRLPDSVIADLTAWVKSGAIDPREGAVVRPDKALEWEVAYQQRLQWWSLQPMATPNTASLTPSRIESSDWCRNEVDHFILSKLHEHNVPPASEADRRALVRRLSLTLTGLPPSPELVEQFYSDTSPSSYEDLVTQLLDSPHFGERWARHWMDVVHYSDTHGYEWDVPAKNAWRYRDYLIRAFNDDLSYRQLVLEHIAGDLLPARIDPATRINESIIGPMMLRLGERRHGDNAALEGISQEAVANMIDTLGKAFLATTLACAQCHDHKLDAVQQSDYYSLAGMLMSTRMSARPIDAIDPNEAVIGQLRTIKDRLQGNLSSWWLDATSSERPGSSLERLRSIPADETPSANFPSSIVEFWKRSLSSPVTAEQFKSERERRRAANHSSLQMMADFSDEEIPGGWQWEGFGMQHGLVADGELVVADEGDTVALHLLPAGRFSHVWSPRLAGSLQSPQLDPTRPLTFSLQTVSGKFASHSFIVDRAINPERLQFSARPFPQWLTVTAGNFDSLEGTVDTAPRRVYFELATKSLNNYFPPRVGYGGVPESELDDPRSWFGVSRIYQHQPGQPPQDELERFVPLFDQQSAEQDWGARLVSLIHDAVWRWSIGACTPGDVQLLNDALEAKLLPNELSGSESVARLVGEYRTMERELQPDRTVGSAADWYEGVDERLAIRGVYTDLGDPVLRGRVRFLDFELEDSSNNSHSSGRLEWAQQLTSPNNPLIARVYVNRVWHYLFGSGLVRTTDDFGHLGEIPSHPELLDYLAAKFVDDGWSTKRLIRQLVTSATWRQSSRPDENAVEVDPENRLWHHFPLRRLEAEAIRDAMLAVSGRLDAALYGPAIEPYRTSEDSQKRLFIGPLDGQGRRSIYLEMTLMEPPRFLAVFNQPIPTQTVGRRDVTNTPDQALALLNDPLVAELSRHWSEMLMEDGAQTIEERAERMLRAALGRPGQPSEVRSLAELVKTSANLRGLTDPLLGLPQVWQDAAHAVFNLKEFIYVP